MIPSNDDIAFGAHVLRREADLYRMAAQDWKARKAQRRLKRLVLFLEELTVLNRLARKAIR